MREDVMEKLDELFPNGYIIVYTCPDGQVRMSLYNPQKYEIIDRYHQLLKENK